MKRLLILIWMLVMGWSLSAQITRIEYFWDTDPGFDNGIPLPITSGDSVSGVFSFSTFGLDPGLHTLYIRSRDASGRYSVFNKRMIHIKTPVYPVTTAEYFFNNDPGYGQGTPITITPGDSISLIQSISTAGLPPGIHTVYVRVRDTQGKWSVFSRRLIHVQHPNLSQITAAEYFVDNDPGFGNGTAISITPGDSIDLMPTINTASLSPGIHTVYIRVKGANGGWSVFSKRLIHIKYPEAPEIVAAEYFVDADPGLGNATPISLTPGDSVLANFQIPTSSLALGIHMVYVRVKYSNDQWSVFSKKLIYIDNPAEDSIVAAEYFVNTDPGIGKAVPINITVGDSVMASFQAPTDTLLIGPHWIYVRVQDQKGRWSVFSKDSFYVDNFNCPIYSNGEIELTGDTCRGSQLTFKDNTAFNSGVNSNDYTREWDIFNDGSVDFTPDSIVHYTFNQTGTYTVKLKVYETATPICQEIIYKTFTIRRIDTTNNNISICDGDSVLAEGAYQKITGTYYDNLKNTYGCDSVHITNLTVIPNVSPSITITVNNDSICSGTTAVFTATPVNGGGSPYYTWKVNGVIVGTGYSFQGYNPFGISTLADGDTVTCEMASNETCTVNNPAVSNAVIMKVTTSVAASISIVVDTNSFCYGTTATFNVSGVTNEGTNPEYSWYVNNNLVQTGGTTFASSTLGNGDFVRCYLTSDAICVNNSPVSSNLIYMNVFSTSFPTVSIGASANNICYGTTVSFTANSSNGGSNPDFQWFLNDVLVQAGTSNTYSIDTLDDGDEIKCVLTSNSPCRLADYDTSNTLIMDIIYNLPVSVTFSVSSNSICEGEGVTFSASVTNGGLPDYEFFVNGTSVQNGLQHFYSSNTLNDGDSAWVIVTSSITCATNNPAVSDTVYMSVIKYDTVSVSISTAFDTICEGTNAIFTATALNPGVNPTYVWEINNFQVQVGPSDTYSSSTLGHGNVVRCRLIGDHTCVTPVPAVSNPITMTVYDTLMPVALVTAAQTTVCEGTQVNFTATLLNEGSNPVIEWLLNNHVVQTGGLSYSSDTLKNLDGVRMRLTSDYVCPIQNPVSSPNVAITVLDSIQPSVFAFHGPNPACPGNLITLFTTTNTGGPSPVYEFRVNGNVVLSGPQSQYTSGGLNHGDVVQVTMKSNAACLKDSFAVSNFDTIVIQSAVAADVSIQVTASALCAGDPQTFEATPVNGGSNPIYTWRVNNVPFQSGTSNIFTTAALQNGDMVFCEMNSALTCATNNPAKSNTIIVQFPSTIVPSVAISVSDNNICLGSSVTFLAQSVNGGSNPIYDWKVNGISVQTGPDDQYTSSTLTNGDEVIVSMTSSLGCANPIVANSNIITMIVSSSHIPGVSVNASATSICSGNIVMFTANPINGGTSPDYQWKLNGLDVGTNSAVFNSTTLNNYDMVSVVMTSNSPCASPLTATSNVIEIFVFVSVPASVSISTGSSNVCAGDNVTFTAIPINGGATPVYQWQVNGANVGSNSHTFSSSALNNQDTVKVIMSSSDSCASPAAVTSNEVVMSVSPVITPSVIIIASDTIIFNGQNVTFTATPVNGGGSPFYQWQVNGFNVGFNSNTFNSNGLNNNDQVRVIMNSSASCTSPTADTSNVIIISVSASVTVFTSAEICDGDSLFVGGAYQTTSGTYRDTLIAPAGYDSIIVTQLAIVQVLTTAMMVDICTGDSIYAGGGWQNNSGIFYDTLISSSGCDSVIITDLSVSLSFYTNRSLTICAGDSVFIGGAYQSSPDFYYDTTTLAGGCDSIVITNLQVITALPVYNRTISICQGDSIFAGGAYRYQSGFYYDTFSSAFGCDSVIETYLIVLPVTSVSRPVIICSTDSFFAGGAYQHNTGIYYDTLMGANGCDSIAITDLTVVTNYLTSIARGICDGDSLFLGGQYQTTGGIYYDTLASAGGCDSVIQTDLTVASFFLVTVHDTICGGESVFVGGANQTVSGTYYDTLTARGLCDSVIQTHLFVSPLPIVSFSGLPPDSICSANPPAILVGIPQGGVFSGTGIVGNSFVPADSIVGGPYDIKYTYTDRLGCRDSAVQQVSVSLSPPANFSGLDYTYCLEDTVVTLTGSSPAGLFTGPGVSNNFFVPFFAGVGVHHVIYRVPASNECDASSSQMVIIYPQPEVSIDNLDHTYCENDPVVNVLTTPATGGILEGDGISGTQFDPGFTGSEDDQWVVHFYHTDTNSCYNEVFHSILINRARTPVFAGVRDEYCTSDLPVILNAFPLVGSFAGPGVHGNVLYPDSAGAGVHQISYDLTNANGCYTVATKTIVVHAAPTLTFHNLNSQYCYKDPMVVIKVSPEGGKFTGPGILGSVFDPVLSGTGGPYTITYEYTDSNGCKESISQDITVNNSPYVEIAGLDDFYPVNHEPVTMSGFPAGGEFTGAGVQNDLFDPAKAGVGMHTIIYSYANISGCSNSVKFGVQVGATGIEPMLLSELINIYPNPFSDELNINLSVTMDGKVDFYLRDIMGKIVLHNEFVVINGDNTWSVSLDEMAAGVYLIELRSYNSIYHKKMIRVE